MVRALGMLTTIPMLLVAGPLVSFFLGNWLDRKFGTGWIMPVAVLVGLAAGIRETIRVIRRAEKEQR